MSLQLELKEKVKERNPSFFRGLLAYCNNDFDGKIGLLSLECKHGVGKESAHVSKCLKYCSKQVYAFWNAITF